MEVNVIVLGARPWNLVDEKTGQSRTGVSLHYLTTDNLLPYTAEDGTQYGYTPCKQSISVEEAANLKSVPGIYKARMEMRASKGQNILAIAALEFVSDFSGDKSKK